MNANVRCRPWKNVNPPKKILAIRLQAFGDTLITLPYLQELKNKLPDTTLHFFTREEVASIPKEASFLDRVITIKGGRNAKIQFLLALIKVPYLLFQRYDFILDLQNNRISRVLRTILSAKGWSEFDKLSPMSAAERTRQTVNAGKFCELNVTPKFSLRKDFPDRYFSNHNIRPNHHDLIVLNPAGYCPSRNWPLDNYVTFAKLWLEQIDKDAYFLLLLLPTLREKARYIKEKLGHNCIDLTGTANQVEALQIIQHSKFMLTEDSGLMHMAWTQQIPTVALFSSSKKEWSAPQGDFSICLDSSDLECGPCLKEICIYNDNRCLSRYTPEIVLSKAKELISKRITENA